MSSTDFLHGVRTIEYDDGAVNISTANVSVIGIVGTAPNVKSGAKASAVTGDALLDNRLLFQAENDGVYGNTFSITIKDGKTVASESEVTAEFLVDSFSFSRQPDGSVDVYFALPIMDGAEKYFLKAIKFANLIKDHLFVDPDSNCSFTVTYITPGGDGLIKPYGKTQFSGGEEEPFPLNKLSVIAGNSKKAELLGSEGTLPAAVKDIFNQHKALIVVSRVETCEDSQEQEMVVANGLYQLTEAGQVLGITPRIIIAPDYSASDSVAAMIEIVANALRGVGYIDSPKLASPSQVVARRQNYGARIEILRPRVYTTSDISGNSRPYSACAAGLRSRIDSEKGFWWSKSNQQILGVTGVEQPDEFIIGETNCTANLLNGSQVSTIIRRSGFRHWGNYLCSTNPQWAFECVRRTADVIEDSIAETVQNEFVDRPIDVHLGEDIIETINGFLRELFELGAINGGKAWLDAELNTAESLAAGKLYINVDFAPKSPAQTITITYRINNDYTVEQFAELLNAA
ncbi:phage tail sheath subtilisin-like domain-containing protein [Leclercia adecarboxylata]|uniref:phage tail sheath family protein n=1 Tax=Leclercia adecarboxylata TaxID=83655 RepID=UPI002DBA5927|nr:phage tail sheath C-terminal domain-containing protein [Leclercia adecarboxylata]MEB5748655.1 phage tail sheath subtilisin-like domain-containing protein [Leclercia adecarboxylata]